MEAFQRMSTHGGTLSRRDILRVLGSGAGAALLTGRVPIGAARQASAAITFPQGAVIRSVLRDIDPAALNGAVLFHEHLSIRLNVAAHYTDDVAMVVEEARRARVEDNLACIVDGGHEDMRRNIDALRRIMSESGLPVVANGGLAWEFAVRSTEWLPLPQRCRIRLRPVTSSLFRDLPAEVQYLLEGMPGGLG